MRTTVGIAARVVEPIAAQGRLLQYRSYLLLRAVDAQGSGFVWWDEALRQLSVFKSRRQARNILDDACDGIFARKIRCRRERRFKIKLTGWSALLAAFGVARSPVVDVPVEALLAPCIKETIYLAVAAGRNGRPTARSTRTTMSGVSKSTQRRAEKRAGVERERNYVEHPEAGLDTCRDAGGLFVRAQDLAVFEEISITTFVPTDRARVRRRRASAPGSPTGAYKSRRQPRYYRDDERAKRVARKGSARWRHAEPEIAGGAHLLAPLDPSAGCLTENGQRVAFWAQVRR